jgi:hypothetical protein
VLRATRIAEEHGIPAVAIVATGFLYQAAVTAKALGSPDLAIAEYPGVIPFDTEEELREKTRTTVLEGVIAALTAEVDASHAGEPDPEPRAIVVRGTLDEVQEHFDARGWSDGLPIVPPTRDRVEAFLSWTPRDSDEVLGCYPPELREATVWAVAVNGVMAGCRPEHMPLLVAIAEAVADPGFRLEDAGSTPSWEPLVVVSGRVVQELGFNTGVGAMKMGNRAQASIGRFTRMLFRNVAGFRPGSTDKGTIGLAFNVALGEDEAAIRELGWAPYRVDQGFGLDDSIVTVRSSLMVSAPVYQGGSDPETMIGPLVTYLEGTTGPWFFTALWYSHWHPLVIMSPAVARGLARHGWGKAEIRRHLFEHARWRAGDLETYPLHPAGQGFTLQELVERGSAPASYAVSDDPDRLVPMLLREDWTDIVLAGDPERNQSRIHVNNHEQGAPVSRRIELPEGWEQRLSSP